MGQRQGLGTSSWGCEGRLLHLLPVTLLPPVLTADRAASQPGWGPCSSHCRCGNNNHCARVQLLLPLILLLPHQSHTPPALPAQGGKPAWLVAALITLLAPPAPPHPPASPPIPPPTPPACAQGGKPAWSEVLLDVLLSLLSRPSAPLPSAPLRTACEAVWRVTCDALTQAGMQVRGALGICVC